jgi:peptide deformylase
MALRPIVNVPDTVLRRKAHKVTEFDQDLQTLIDDMVDTLRAAPGVGLAAPQVGISERVIVIEYSADDSEDENAPKKLFTLVNPEIIKASEDIETGVEACLSIPGLVGEVDRAYQIMVKAQNRRGQNVKIKARGWLARIFQHEIDHLDGVLFTDRAEKVWKPSAEEQAAIRD